MSMVEWKKLGEVCTVITPPIRIGTGDYCSEGIYPIIDQGQNVIVGYTDNEDAVLKEDEYVLFGDHTRYVKFYKGKFAQGADGLKILRAKDAIASKYLYYVFSNIDIPSRGYNRHWIIAKEFQIPIPSLSEQSRIVGILDTFTASIANLKEQIGERRKQYEHYRDHLLDSVIEKKALRDIIVRSCTGATPLKSKKEYYENGSIPWLRTQEVCFNEIVCTECFITEEALHKTSVKWIPANSIIVAISGATAGRCAINKIPLTTNQHCLCLEINEKKALYKFVYYCICKQKDELIGKKEGARGDLNTSKVLSLQIAYPSLEEQSRIVSILDQFEASIANLEAQLQEREKQYEHYRNQLLTFE